MLTQNMVRMYEDIFKTNNKLETAFHSNKCSNQIKLPILPHTCVHFSKLPSNKCTTMLTLFIKSSYRGILIHLYNSFLCICF